MRGLGQLVGRGGDDGSSSPESESRPSQRQRLPAPGGTRATAPAGAQRVQELEDSLTESQEAVACLQAENARLRRSNAVLTALAVAVTVAALALLLSDRRADAAGAAAHGVMMPARMQARA